MTDMAADDKSLKLERMIAAPLALLFELCTEPAELVKWWAPDGYRAAVDVFDLRPGGRWRITLHGSRGHDVAMGGAFRLIEPPRRLVYSWAWETPDAATGNATEVEMTFAAVPGGTRVILEHRHFADAAACQRHVAGWSASFDRLGTLAARATPP